MQIYSLNFALRDMENIIYFFWVHATIVFVGNLSWK